MLPTKEILRRPGSKTPPVILPYQDPFRLIAVHHTPGPDRLVLLQEQIAFGRRQSHEQTDKARRPWIVDEGDIEGRHGGRIEYPPKHYTRYPSTPADPGPVDHQNYEEYQRAQQPLSNTEPEEARGTGC